MLNDKGLIADRNGGEKKCETKNEMGVQMKSAIGADKVIEKI